MRREANIEDWRVFCAIAKTGSIHAAADLLGSVDSLVSRTLTGLEKSLGCQLINRDKRPFSLTASGEIAQLHGQRLVEEYDHLVEELQSAPHQLAGPLRVGIPPGVLDGFLIEHLANFHRDYPDIELSVVDWHSPMPISFDSPNGRLDIVSAYGPDPASPEIVQIQYGTGLVLPCASPLYLARHHYPQSPDDVRDLTGIVFYSPLRPMISSLQRNGVKKTLPWGRRMIFYSAQTAKATTVVGSGINPGIPTLHCARELKNGSLVPVMPGWTSDPLKLYLYMRPESLRLRRVRVFARWYCQVMQEIHNKMDNDLSPILEKFFAGTDFDFHQLSMKMPLLLNTD